VSAITRRFVTAFGILLGLMAAVDALWLVLRLFIPAWGALGPWLPEDLWAGLWYQFLSDLADWLPSLGLSALLLTCSYWLRPEELPKAETEALSRSSFLAMAASVAFAVVALLGQPWVSAQLDDLAFRNQQTRQLEDAFLSLKNKGVAHQTPADLNAMLSLLKRLGVLRPYQSQQKSADERVDYDFQLQILRARFDLADFFRLRTLPGAAAQADESKETVDELLTNAEQALKADDEEFQANLWGVTAYRRLINAADQGTPIDGRLMDRAKNVVDASWRSIYAKTLASDERKRASYFFRKGKSLGDFQFQNYLEAYYGFLELYDENPNDAEVAQHKTLSKEKLTGQVLFSQEMDVLFAVPGSENLVFLNRDSPREVVRIGKVLNTSDGVYVKDFEFLRTNAQGDVLLHWTAPYGRWDDGIDFRVWDEEKPESRFPEVLAETPGNEYNPLNTVDPPRFKPRVTVRDLELVGARQLRPQTLGTADLLTHGKAIEALGYNSRLFQTEFVVRLASPLGYFVAMLLVFALGWTNRAHEGSRTWWLLVPVLPLVTEFAVQTSAWAIRLVVGGLLALTDLWLTVAVLAAAFVAASIASIVWLQVSFRKSLA
jgi:hypothetical protein